MKSFAPCHIRDTLLSFGDGWRQALRDGLLNSTIPDAVSAPYTHVHALDDNLPSALTLLKPSLSKSDVSCLVDIRKNGLLCFDDQWSCLAWSGLYAQQSERLALPTVLLHVDSHADLQPPRIVEIDGHLRNVLTGSFVSLQNPASVLEAILTGAVDIASFIPLLAHSLPDLTIRHLTPHKSSATREPAVLYLPASPRFGVDEGPLFQNRAMQTSATKATIVERIATTSCEEWCGEIPRDANVLLHVDLDYFNNRYRGGAPGERHDPTLSDMRIAGSDMLRALRRCLHTGQVANVTVAFSPGFFPSCYWSFGQDIVDELPFVR